VRGWGRGLRDAGDWMGKVRRRGVGHEKRRLVFRSLKIEIGHDAAWVLLRFGV
jgi:hypothetical protein